jgi:hypothetical protein
VAYALVTAAGAYTNFWAALIPLAQAASLVALPTGEVPWGRLLPAWAGLAVLLVPLALLIHAEDSAGTDWAAGSAAGRVLTRLRGSVPRGLLDLAVLAVVVVLVVAALVLRRRVPPGTLARHWPLLLALAWLVVPLAGLVLLSVAYKPLLVLRYLVVCLPAAFLLLGLALDRLARAPLVAVGGVLVLASVAGVWQWDARGQSEDWRGAAALVASEAGPGDGIVVYAPYTRMPFQWYAADHPGLIRDTTPVFPAGSWATGALGFDTYIPVDGPALVARTRGLTRIWVVLSHVQGSGPQEVALLGALTQAGYTPTGRQGLAGVTVLQYGPGPTAVVP